MVCNSVANTYPHPRHIQRSACRQSGQHCGANPNLRAHYVRTSTPPGPVDAFAQATGLRPKALKIAKTGPFRYPHQVYEEAPDRPFPQVRDRRAVRVRDIERIQPLKCDAFYRKASELAGVWPPALPADPIDLSTTRSLIETAHAHATLVNLQIEREDPDVAFIGVPTRWSPKNLWLHEVSDRAIWDDTDSKWPFADITRVEFSSTYEDDLLLVAGPPPDR